MGKKDDRDDQEKKDWDSGKFDDPKLEAAREKEERDAGNPLAPPE